MQRVETPDSLANSGGQAWNGQSASGPGGILDLWNVAKFHKKTLLALMGAGTLLGFLAGIPKTPVYRATTSVEVLSLNQDFMNMKQTTPVTAADVSFETSELQTQIRILSSDSLIQRVSDKLVSSVTPGKQAAAAPFSSWRNFLKLRKPSREELVERAAKSVKVSALGRTRILEVAVDSADSQLAADFANALANEYIEQTIETRWKMTQNTNVWLSRELADVRAKLARSDDALQAYARNSGLIFTDADTNIVTEKLQQIQQQLSSATADRIDKQARNELALASPPESLPEILGDPGLRDLAAKITDLKRQIANLGATYTPEFAKSKRLQAELEALEASYNQDRAEILSRIKNEYQSALRREQLLSRDYQAQTKQVAGQGEKSVQYNILKREADSNRQLYDTMLQQLKQSSVISAMQASNVRVLDPAKVPTEPFSPNFKTNSAVGLVTGLLIGLVFLMARQRNNTTLREPGDVQFWTSLPELGSIPNASSDGGKRIYQGPPRRAEALGTGPNGLIDLDPQVKNLPTLALQRYQPSLLADAFRSVIASILFANEDGTQPRTLVLTSASPADGKTTVIVNLGIAMAETQKRVLIIDADLRGPRIHSQFAMTNEQGLTDLLGQTVLDDEALKSVIRASGVAGLDVLTSGTPTESAARLLHSPILPKLLTKCRNKYDLILIDTPPMLHMPDARIVGKLADAVVLVARAEKTTRDAIIAAKQRFADDGVRVMGTVLNGWDPKKSQRAYYGYYGAAVERHAG